MKLGHNLPRAKAALAQAGMAERAIYVERATMEGEQVLPLAEADESSAPYFSMILVPGQGRRP
jgi:precorrin-2/cobalt-factor-2 C20-methyltransferase